MVLEKVAEDEPPTACAICGKDDEVVGYKEEEKEEGGQEASFALRCNSCRRWYHPWCMGYQLDLDRSCLITSLEVDIDIDIKTGLPLACQWFCDSCASTETGVVAATSKRRQAPAGKKSRNSRNSSSSSSSSISINKQYRKKPASGGMSSSASSSSSNKPKRVKTR